MVMELSLERGQVGWTTVFDVLDAFRRCSIRFAAAESLGRRVTACAAALDRTIHHINISLSLSLSPSLSIHLPFTTSPSSSPFHLHLNAIPLQHSNHHRRLLLHHQYGRLTWFFFSSLYRIYTS